MFEDDFCRVKSKFEVGKIVFHERGIRKKN